MWFLVSLCCSRAPIEDNWTHGPTEQVKDVFTSAVLLNTQAGSVLVDTGINQDSKPLLRALKNSGKTADDVIAILITHGHSDHISGIANFPNALVYAHQQEEELLSESDVTPDYLLTDGDILNFGEVEIEVFHVVGHTEGNMVLLIDDVLMMGDTAQSYRDGSISPVAEKYSEDPDQTERSLKELGQRMSSRVNDVSWMIFSHSGPLKGLQPLLNFSAQ